MKTFKSILAVAAAAALAVCAGEAASATTYVDDLGLLNTPGVTVPFAGNPSPIAGNGNSYAFDFYTTSPWRAIFQMQLSNSGPDPIQFELEKLVSGNYQLVATSNYETGADFPQTGRYLLGAGHYRLLTDKIGLPSNDDGILTGGINFAAVPEPGTWAMLTLGVGLVGFAARRRREGMVAAA